MSFASKEMQKYKALTIPIYDTPKTLQQTIPIYQIAEDGIFLLEKKKEAENKRFDKLYLLLDTNYSTKTEDEQEDFIKKLVQVFNSLNVSWKECIMNNNRNMKQLRKEIFIRNSDGDFKELIDSYNERFINSIKQGRNGIEQVKLFVLSCDCQSFDQARDYFRTIESNLMLNFSRLGSGLIPLDAVERLRYLHSFYRLGKEEEFNFDFKNAVKKGADWKNDICNLSITQYTDEYGKFDGMTMVYDTRYVRVLISTQLPTGLNDDFINFLASTDFNSIVTIDAAPIPQDVAMKCVMDYYMANGRTIDKQQEQRNKARAYSADIPYETRKQKEEIEGYLDIMNENDEKMFYMALYVVVIGNSMEELENNVLSICSKAENRRVRLEPAMWNQMNALNTALPTGTRLCDASRPILTQSLCAFSPFNVQELHDKDGIFYGINQVSKNILVGNRKKLKNPHGFVLGTTGGGKGYTVKDEMCQVVLKTTDDVIVIDQQNEYKEVAKALKGQFIDISSASRNHINPLDLDTYQNFESKPAFVADKTELMLGIAGEILTREITMGQKSIVGRCVGQLLSRALSDMEHKKKVKSPTMDDFYELVQQQEEPEAKDLKLGFELFVKGALNIFSKPTNVNTKNRFIVYGLNDLGGDLAPVGQLVMLESIRDRIATNFKKGIATWLYIDEFHNMTKRLYTIQYLQKIWKEVRKLGCLCTGATQNMADLLKSAEIETMLCNSEYISLLPMAPNEAAVMQQVLDLNENLAEYVRDTKAGNGLIKFGDNRWIPKENEIAKGTLIYDLFNTDFHEKQEARKYKLKNLKKEMAVMPFESQIQSMGLNA